METDTGEISERAQDTPEKRPMHQLLTMTDTATGLRAALYPNRALRTVSRALLQMALFCFLSGVLLHMALRHWRSGAWGSTMAVLAGLSAMLYLLHVIGRARKLAGHWELVADGSTLRLSKTDPRTRHLAKLSSP